MSSPYINHFLQPDSLIPDPSNPQAWNRFAYVLNNPINAADPSGHQCVGNPEECKDDDGKAINGSGGLDGWDGSSPDDKPDVDLDEILGLAKDQESACTIYSCTENTPSICPFGEICLMNDPHPSYCGGGSNGWFNFFDCGANITQDLALVIDIPFAGAELAFIALGCLGGLKGCVAGAKLGQTLFKYAGANRAETKLSIFSLGFSIAANASENGITGIDENSATAIAGVVAGTLSKDPILDFFIDGYGSGYNHDIFNGVYSFVNSVPLIR